MSSPSGAKTTRTSSSGPTTRTRPSMGLATLTWTRRRRVSRWNGFAHNAAPRPQTQLTCMFCKSKDPLVHRTEPTARVLVDGVEWTLRFDEEGNHHWEAPGITDAEKEAASIDLGQLAQAPSPSLNPQEASFSDRSWLLPWPRRT